MQARAGAASQGLARIRRRDADARRRLAQDAMRKRRRSPTTSRCASRCVQLLQAAARALQRRAVGGARARCCSSCRSPPRSSRWCSPSAANADFTEIAQGAVRALGTPDEPTDLLLALDYRIRHILVDEFQDTSCSQWELLERLTAGWEPRRRAHAVPGRRPDAVDLPLPRGRGGAVPKAQREGLGSVQLEPLTLSTNFRSQAGLVDWVNDAFPRILPGRGRRGLGRGAVLAPPARTPSARPSRLPVTWHAMPDREERGRRGSCELREADRRAAPRSWCATAPRSTRSCPRCARRGIRFRAIEIEPLGERQVVQDLSRSRARSRISPTASRGSRCCARPGARLSLEDLHRIAAENRFATDLGADPGSCSGAWRSSGAVLGAGARQPQPRHAARPRRRRLARARRPGLRREPHRPRGRRDLPRRARRPGGRRRASTSPRSPRARARSTRCPTSPPATTTCRS